MKYTITCLCTLLAMPILVWGSSATLLRVIDGDTLMVQTNGAEERLRVIGIDTPEHASPHTRKECYAEEASARAKYLLPVGQLITLQHAYKRDKYQRLLGYILLPDGRDFGLLLISQGYAKAYRGFDHARIEKYLAAEKEANKHHLGMWNSDNCSYNTTERADLAFNSSSDKRSSVVSLLERMLFVILRFL